MRSFWQSHKERIQAGYVHDVFPYELEKRFINKNAKNSNENLHGQLLHQEHSE
jgi:isocitrate dehydrogenase kinase/phosphatase